MIWYVYNSGKPLIQPSVYEHSKHLLNESFQFKYPLQIQFLLMH